MLFVLMGALTQSHPLKRWLDAANLIAASLIISFALFLTGIPAVAQSASADASRAAELVARVRQSPRDEITRAQARAAAYTLIGAGRYAEALALFNALLEQQPPESGALYGAALANFNLQRIAEAEPLARSAVEVTEKSGAADSGHQQQLADALVLLAVIEAVKGDNTAALATAQKAARIAPQHFDAQFTLGRALYGAGDPAGAAGAFRAAVAIKPDDARARFFLATALERSGDENGALSAYRELVARQPAGTEGHLGLGVLLIKRGGENTGEGIRELERAIALNPNDYEARVTLGRTLMQQGQPAAAVEHLKRATELAPGNPEPHYQLALAYRRLGRLTEAAAESAIVKQIHEGRRHANSKPNMKNANSN